MCQLGRSLRVPCLVIVRELQNSHIYRSFLRAMFQVCCSWVEINKVTLKMVWVLISTKVWGVSALSSVTFLHVHYKKGGNLASQPQPQPQPQPQQLYITITTIITTAIAQLEPLQPQPGRGDVNCDLTLPAIFLTLFRPPINDLSNWIIIMIRFQNRWWLK